MLRQRLSAALAAAAAAPSLYAHPGHPTLDPHHTHGPYEMDPLLALALAAAAFALAFGVRAAWRRRQQVRTRTRR
ncbi:MAG TPA: hypothetical protein VIL43_00410 [Burkholderiales bacterium]